MSETLFETLVRINQRPEVYSRYTADALWTSPDISEMMLRYLGWSDAADLIIKGVAGTIANGELTFDLARLRTAIRKPKRKARVHNKKEVQEQLDALPGGGLVEGGVCNTENIETLREFRNSCDILVAVGACAMSGGVPALRNSVDVRELLEESYINAVGVVHAQIPTDPELPHILEKVSPISEVVKVDFFLPGCPPPADAFWQVLNDIIAGRQPNLPYDLMYFD